MTFVAQLQFPRHAAHLLIGEVADQLLNRSRRDLRPNVHEQDHLRRGMRHAGIHRDRLASVLFQDDGLDTRMPQVSQQLRCAVG